LAGSLPAALAAAIERRLHGVARSALAKRAAAISAHYRDGGGSGAALLSEDDVTAYLVTRMPATYAASAAVLAEIARRAPGFAPVSLIDAGAGPGTASLAAAATWPGLSAITMIDTSAQLLAAGAALAADGDVAALRDARRVSGDLARVTGEADLVVAAYALAEIAEARLAEAVASLWRATTGVLVLVEPGTPAGSQRIRAVRAALIAAGGSVVAPCPHASPCPVVAPDWCHFAVRLARSRDHRLVKGADAPFEDEKYAYVVAARPGIAHAAITARVLAPPRLGKAGITAKVCGADGAIATLNIARRDGDAFRKWRRVGWGDGVE
jgi:ribosomal protein RSM22 (predicted rRNA methylase)